MPTYVYECQRCGGRFEVLQGINDPPRQRCPDCRGKVRRVLMPGGGFVFKGSGFYITDYKQKEDKQRAAREAESKSDAGSGSRESKSAGAGDKGSNGQAGGGGESGGKVKGKVKGGKG